MNYICIECKGPVSYDPDEEDEDTSDYYCNICECFTDVEEKFERTTMTTEQKNRVIEHVKKITREYEGIKNNVLSDKDRKICELVINKFGGNGNTIQNSMIDLISFMTGVDIKKNLNVTSLQYLGVPKYCAVVPLASANGHQYPIGCIALVNNAGSCIMMNGMTGNTIDFTKTYLRMATDKEIENMSDAQLNWISSQVIFL